MINASAYLIIFHGAKATAREMSPDCWKHKQKDKWKAFKARIQWNSRSWAQLWQMTDEQSELYAGDMTKSSATDKIYNIRAATP